MEKVDPWLPETRGRGAGVIAKGERVILGMMKTSWNLIGMMVTQHGELTKCFLSEHFKRSKW